MRVRFASVRFAPVRSASVRSAPVRFAPLRSAPARSARVRSARVRVAPVRTAPVRSIGRISRSWIPAPDHGNGGLNVGPVDRSWSRLAPEIWWRPLLVRVLADERGEHLHHGRVVSGGVAGDALQGVDAADAHVELFEPSCSIALV